MDQRAGSQLSDSARSFLMIDMTRPPIVLAATTFLDCFRTTTWGGKMVSSGVLRRKQVLGTQNPVRWGRVDFRPPKARYSASPGPPPPVPRGCGAKAASAIRRMRILHSRPIFMSVDAATVRRIAQLARIAVTEAEVPHLQGELNAMLAFVEQLS